MLPSKPPILLYYPVAIFLLLPLLYYLMLPLLYYLLLPLLYYLLLAFNASPSRIISVSSTFLHFLQKTLSISIVLLLHVGMD